MLVYRYVTSMVTSRILKGRGGGVEDGEEMIIIFDLRRSGLDTGLEVGVNESRNLLSV